MPKTHRELIHTERKEEKESEQWRQKKFHSNTIFDIETMRNSSHTCHSAFQRM